MRFVRLVPATSGLGSTSGPTVIKGGYLAEFRSGRGPGSRAVGRVTKPQNQLSGMGRGGVSGRVTRIRLGQAP